MQLVSIIVPVYNAERTLEMCVKSILKQTYSSLEVILVDDGSVDRSGSICDKFARNDPRVIVIHQKNKGSIEARRSGLLSSKGEYVCFCDADDVLPKDSISILTENIRNSDLCIGRMIRLIGSIKFPSKHIAPCFQENTTKQYSWTEFCSKLYCSWFGISNVPVGLVAKLYRTNILKEIYCQTSKVVEFYGDDLVITLQYLPKCEYISIIPDIVYYYRVGGGTSKYNPAMMNDWLALYKFKKPFAEKYPMPQDICNLMDIELCNMTYTYLTMLFRSGNFSDEILMEQIEKILSIPEVYKAGQNAKVKSRKFPIIEKIKNNDYSGTFDMLKKDLKSYNKKRWLRKLLNYFT